MVVSWWGVGGRVTVSLRLLSQAERAKGRGEVVSLEKRPGGSLVKEWVPGDALPFGFHFRRRNHRGVLSWPHGQLKHISTMDSA